MTAPPGGKRRVAVVGSGMCGLVAMKECIEAGLDVQGFESEDRVGGLWNFTEDERHSSVYRSTYINTERVVNAFGDFPIPTSFPRLMHWTDMMKYFELYAEHFKLRECIRFETRVLRVTPLGEQRWEVVSQEWDSAKGAPKEGAPRRTEVYGAVLVCTGHHGTPRVPDFPGRQHFRGMQVHSKQYKDSKPFEGKRVVIVGIGNSGGDLVTEISKVAAQVWLVARSGVWVIANPAHRNEVYCRADSNLMGYLTQPWYNWLLQNDPGIKRARNIADKIGLTPRYGITSYHPTVTLNNPQNDLLQQLESGKVAGKQGIQSIQANSVTFTDGSAADGVDAIVYCTGYEISYPYLDNEVRGQLLGQEKGSNEVKLYQYMWPTNEQYSTLAFIGLAQPVGAMAMVADIQARYAAAVLSGRVSLPPRAERERRWREVREHNRTWYYPSPRHTVQMAVRVYMDEVGERLGCTPTVFRLIRQGGLWGLLGFRAAVLALLTPTTNFHYRLVGPGSNMPEAMKALRKEYAVVFGSARNRAGLGLIVDILAKLCIILPIAVWCQLVSLLRRRRFSWHAFV